MRQLPAPLFSTTPIRLPLKTAIKKEVTMTQLATVPLLLPYDCFKQVYNSGSFERTVCEGPHVLEKFWEAVDDHPSLRFHPVKSIPGYQQRAVPLILHGDGAAVTQSIGSGSKSCMFLSWRSLVARSRDNRDCHHLIGAIWSHLLVQGSSFHTANSFWRCVSKSFQFMVDERGQHCGGYFGVVVFNTGDLEYFNSFQGQPRWNSRKPCSLCGIDLDDIKNFKLVKDLEPDDWTSLPRQQSCPLFRQLLSPTCISPDLMHTKHLGTDQRLLGSVAWVLVMELMHQGSVEERLFILLQELKDAFSFFNIYCFNIFLLYLLFQYLSFILIASIVMFLVWIVRAIRKCGQLTDYMGAFPNSHLVSHRKACPSCFLYVYIFFDDRILLMFVVYFFSVLIIYITVYIVKSLFLKTFYVKLFRYDHRPRGQKCEQNISQAEGQGVRNKNMPFRFSTCLAKVHGPNQ